MEETVVMTRAQLDAIAGRIAELALRIDTAKHALLAELREFDDIPRWDGIRFELGHVLDAVLHAAAA